MNQKAKELAMFFLRQKGITKEASFSQIKEAVDNTLKIFPDIDASALEKHIDYEYKIWVEDVGIIEKQEAKRPWLASNKAKIEWVFWNRYKRYLEENINLPPQTILSIANDTDDILDALFEPKQKTQIDKRGMVVGQVQSGKTANYTGLICKAADAGFKVIIVLAGIHKNLRSQTQMRLDKGFLGFDTQQERVNRNNILWVGVGEPPSNRHFIARSLTSSSNNGDFNKNFANNPLVISAFRSEAPILAVVKKNATVLDRLEQWLSLQTNETIDGRKIIRNKPLLLIDDEADNASINTRRDDLKPTKINGQIRNLLRLFEKSAYVGYTATPFANIFIPMNDDNLFPRDFITNLSAPSDYIGPDKIFGFEPLEDDEEPIDTLPVLHRIDDYHSFVPDKHKLDDELPESIPESLKTAIKCFILTCAIRRLRGQGDEHNSMLVHVTRFKVWQSKVKELVEGGLSFYQMGIEQNNATIIDEIRQAFETDVDDYRSFVTASNQILNSPLSKLDPSIQAHNWQEVVQHLHPAASKIQIKEIHGGAKDVLDYQAYNKEYMSEGEEAGLSVIAVGGNKLSRGLTLEGLSVSYYLRASRMYDTLMQMGRWFGYRKGYVDLCRLFTSADLINWFCHITRASNDLRKEFDYMKNIDGSSPEQYAMRVRTHPDKVLQISASNKIRKAIEVDLSWSGRLVQSYKLYKNTSIISSNFDAYKKLVESMAYHFNEVGSNRIWYDVDASMIKAFLNSFTVHMDILSASPVNLSRYIDEANHVGELKKWRVALMSRGNTGKVNVINGYSIGWFNRKHQPGTPEDSYYINKSNITSRPDEFIDMKKPEREEYLLKNIAKWKHTGSNKPRPVNPDGMMVRNEYRKPNKPLILLYLLDPSEAGLINERNPFVAFAISFPGSNSFSAFRFAIHEDQIPNFNTVEIYDEDD